jgi:hypothetical protein
MQLSGNLVLAGWRPTGELPMDEQTKSQIWDLAAGTFIAVSVFSSMAFIGRRARACRRYVRM